VKRQNEELNKDLEKIKEEPGDEALGVSKPARLIPNPSEEFSAK
jgi:hypothetical protein